VCVCGGMVWVCGGLFRGVLWCEFTVVGSEKEFRARKWSMCCTLNVHRTGKSLEFSLGLKRMAPDKSHNPEQGRF